VATERSYALAALGGATFIAFSAPLVRVAEASPAASTLMRCGFALPVLWLLMVLEERRPHTRPSTRDRWLMRLAGACLAGDLLLWVNAISAVGAGLATVLGNLQVLAVGGLAWWLLGERPRRSLALALPVMLVGVVLVSGVVGQGAYGDDPLAGVLYGGGASLMYAAYLLLLRAATRTAPPAGASRPGVVRPLAEATLGATVAGAVASLVLPGFDLGGGSGVAWSLLLALTSQVVGWLLITAGMPHLPAAVTSVLLLVQPVLAVVVGFTLLAERPSGVQLLGVALIIGGVVVTTLGTRRTPIDPVPPEVPAALER